MNKDHVYILHTIPECVVISKYIPKFLNSPCFKRCGPLMLSPPLGCGLGSVIHSLLISRKRAEMVVCHCGH